MFGGYLLLLRNHWKSSVVRLGFGKIIRQKPEEWIMISKLESKWPSYFNLEARDDESLKEGDQTSNVLSTMLGANAKESIQVMVSKLHFAM